MKEKVVLIFSGGLDSLTLLRELNNEGFEIFALSFDYGQRHSKELVQAAKVCDLYDIRHKIVDITAINSLLQGSALTSDIPVPKGHYSEDSMKATVVPNRNMIMLSLATGYAVSLGISKLYYGAQAGDEAIYPDCRPEFVRRMNAVVAIANEQAVEIRTPYMHMKKADLIRIGRALNIDYSQSWTCYEAQENGKSCGQCGSCVERILGFVAAELEDPLEYEGGWETAKENAIALEKEYKEKQA